MTTTELLALAPETGIDRWLFAGELVERWNGFHSPTHAATCANLSGLLAGWCRASGGISLQAFVYGCPYRLAIDPDTYVSFDASAVALDHNKRLADLEFVEGPPASAIEVLELDEDMELVAKLVERTLHHGAAEV